MTTVILEAAALSDCFKRANRVAPRSGPRTAALTGFVLTLAGQEVTVRTTNGDVFYAQRLHALESDAPAQGEQWRIPSQVATRVVSSLPQGKGKTVTLSSAQGVVRISAGQMSATLALVDHSGYPEWGFHPTEGASLVEGFGTQLDQVAWACERNTGTATSCVRVDGQWLMAATPSALAATPCQVPLEGRSDVLLPLAVLAPILSQMRDTLVQLAGNLLVLTPTPDTQILCTTMDLKFPNVAAPMGEQFSASAALDRGMATEILARVRAIVDNDEGGHVWLTVGRGQVSFFSMDSTGSNSVSDVVELAPGQAPHEPVTMRMSAETLTAVLGKAPGESLTLCYDAEGKSSRLRVDGSGQYSCWIPLIRNT